MSLPMQAIKVLISSRKSEASAGMLRCDQASADYWTPTRKWIPCWTRSNVSRRPSVPRSNIRSHSQTSIRLPQGTLSWAGKEYRATHNAFCVGQPVDDAPETGHRFSMRHRGGLRCASDVATLPCHSKGRHYEDREIIALCEQSASSARSQREFGLRRPSLTSSIVTTGQRDGQEMAIQRETWGSERRNFAVQLVSTPMIPRRQLSRTLGARSGRRLAGFLSRRHGDTI